MNLVEYLVLVARIPDGQHRIDVPSLAFTTQHIARSTQHAPSTRHPAPGTQHQAPSTQH